MYKYIIEATLKQQESLKIYFLNYMQCTRTLAPTLFNSNVKGKQFRHVPKCKV